MSFAITADFEKRRRDDHENFYCPSGHTNIYRGENDAEKLRRENQILKQQQARLQDVTTEAWRAVNIAQSRLQDEVKARKRIEKRISAGVCPDCNRTFGDMAAHMKSKHGGVKCEPVEMPAKRPRGRPRLVA
jgi:hypothetical protein